MIIKESLESIRYKWEHGIYDRYVMIKLVNQGTITEEEFKEITREYYESAETV